jgi:hypothetical protein
MGREAETWAEAGSEAGEVRALLESGELILRGAIRRRFPRDKLSRVRVEDDLLRFDCAGEAVTLALGAVVADRWAKAIAKPPPSLREKLGLAAGGRAFRIGTFEDVALEKALADACTDDAHEADMVIACIAKPGDLNAALAAHKTRPAIPLWAIYPKGKGVTFGDGEIRSVLRARGFVDTKSCAVSELLTASRYGIRK